MSAVTGPRYSSGIMTSVCINGSSNVMFPLSALLTASEPAALNAMSLEISCCIWAERIVKLPRDAIAFGKAAMNLALDSLGMTSQFAHGYVVHALSTNIRYEGDEYNFMKKRRDEGVRNATHGREQRYDDSERKS